MPKSTFSYETYIATTVDTLWKALLDGEFTRQYWGHENISDWQEGSEWEHRRADATRALVILGEVLEATPPNRLVISWAEPQHRGVRARHSRVTFELEPIGDTVRLTVTHDELESGSEMERKVARGWPRVLSSLKTLLETGRALDTWASK
ncbi:MAG TPA: SRPBCC family protein [Bryobacteraceae bacterium]|nr:SRPBCC family protein [Bryobacteraceae bacterium]